MRCYAPLSFAPLSFASPPSASAFALALALSACGGSDAAVPIKADTGGEDGSGEGGGLDGSDGASGVDNDGDGFSVEDGDCDDEDFRVNPAWPEEPDDGIDNDCDGRIDESWKGFVVATQRGGARSSLLLLDTVGREESELTLPADVVPWSVSAGGDGDTWVSSYPYFAEVAAGVSPIAEGLVLSLSDDVPWYQPSTLLSVNRSGTATAVETFGDPDYDGCFALPESSWGDCFGDLAPRFYFYGPLLRSVLELPDGRVALLLPGELRLRELDGSIQSLGTWPWNMLDEEVPFEMYGHALAYDPLRRQIGVAGLLGGFATWSEAEGFQMRATVDLGEGFNPDAIFVSSGLGYVPGAGFTTVSSQFSTGQLAVRQFNLDTGRWAEVGAWTDGLITPLGLDVDESTGDLYVTAKGGEARAVFRVRAADRSIDDFYQQVTSDVNAWGISARY